MPPNMNPSYTHFTSLLNYGNKPCIQYHGETNTLKIIVATHKNGTADKEKVFMRNQKQL